MLDQSKTAPGTNRRGCEDSGRDKNGPPYHRITLADKWRLLQLIIADTELSATTKVTAVFLLDCFNLGRDPNKACFPKIETIAEAIGKGRTAVKRAIAELVEREWLSKHRHRRTYYVFAFDRLVSREGRKTDHAKSESQTKGSKNRPPNGLKPDHSNGPKMDHSKFPGINTGNGYRESGAPPKENDLFGGTACRSEYSRKRKPNRRSQLPETWRPSEMDIAAAREIGVSGEAIPREAERFKNYHKGKGTLMLNWHWAWRNWCIKAVEIAQERSVKTNGNSRSFADGVMAAGERRGWKL